MPNDTVALGVQVPDSFKTIGEAFGIANAAQQYKRQGVALEQDRALLQPNIEKGQAESKQAQIAANLAQFRLKGEQVQKARDILTGLQADPDFINGNTAGMIPKIAQARQRMIDSSIPPQIAEVQTAPLFTMTAHDPKSVRQFLVNTIRGGQNAQAQADVVNTPLTPVGAGGTIQPTQFQPGAAQPATGAVIPLTIAPGEREVVSNNPVTQSPQVVTKGPQGNVVGVTPAPVAPGIPQLAPGDPQEIPQRTAQRVAVNQAAANVPEQHFNNRQIIELAPKAFTGAGSQALGKVFSAYGIQQVPGDEASNYQRLGHFMARQVQANATAMGAGPDQAREIAANAVGTTNWTKDAIVSTAKVNDAFATGLEHFNQGMEKAIQANGGNVLAVRDFQNAWSANFDPRAMQIYNAVQSGDKAEINAVVKQVGGKNSAQARDLIQKARNLETLTNQGHL